MSLFSTPQREATCTDIELVDPVFISDLHLSDLEPHSVQTFLDFMRSIASRHQELLILGDLFDYWVGDDSIDTVAPIVAALQHFAKDRRLYIMQGNRDFLLGRTFCQTVNATLLADPCVASMPGHRILLSHGDLWCTDDTRYQAVRSRVRSAWWQWAVLRLPLSTRLNMALQARDKSRKSKQHADLKAMEVVDQTVLEAADRAQADWIIHGHTHNPGVTVMTDTLTRWVLPDWKFSGEYSHVGYVTIEHNRPEFKHFL